MAPSNYDEDCTITRTGYYTRSDATTNTATCRGSYTASSTGRNYTVAYSYGAEKEREAEIEELFFKKELMEEIKEGWFNRLKPIKPIIKRPDIQLRGVCFNGRGWA